MKRIILLSVLIASTIFIEAQGVDYSVVSVNQESGINFKEITNDNDYVCMPIVKRNSSGCNWYTNHIIDVSIDGTEIAFLASRNNATNIFIKDLSKAGASRQRTNRNSIIDFSYSPNGKNICFAEKNGKYNAIFQTSSTSGYICRQIVTGCEDYSPVYSKDMTQVFFARQENKNVSIWSYNIKDNFVSSYTAGMNPCPLQDGKSMLCSRYNAGTGKNEIWRVNTLTGVEECIVSDANKSFTSPSVSPDGKWILFVGSSPLVIPNSDRFFYNTDIYVCHIDGTEFTQLTYHAADDLSPAWSADGKSIYFVSQRGSNEGKANIWKMDFKL